MPGGNVKISWGDTHFSDAKIQYKRGTWDVHCVILASYSEYFKRIFLGNFREAKEKCIDLTESEFSSAALENMLRWMYGEIYIPAYKKSGNINDDLEMYRVADYFQIPGLEEVALQAVQDGLGSLAYSAGSTTATMTEAESASEHQTWSWPTPAFTDPLHAFFAGLRGILFDGSTDDFAKDEVKAAAVDICHRHMDTLINDARFQTVLLHLETRPDDNYTLVETRHETDDNGNPVEVRVMQRRETLVASGNHFAVALLKKAHLRSSAATRAGGGTAGDGHAEAGALCFDEYLRASAAAAKTDVPSGVDEGLVMARGTRRAVIAAAEAVAAAATAAPKGGRSFALPRRVSRARGGPARSALRRRVIAAAAVAGSQSDGGEDDSGTYGQGSANF